MESSPAVTGKIACELWTPLAAKICSVEAVSPLTIDAIASFDAFSFVALLPSIVTAMQMAVAPVRASVLPLVAVTVTRDWSIPPASAKEARRSLIAAADSSVVFEPLCRFLAPPRVRNERPMKNTVTDCEQR